MESQTSSSELTQKNDSRKEQNKTRNKFCLYQFTKNIINKILKRNSKKYFLESLIKIVKECASKSFISSEEEKMINNIIKIDDIKVSDIMIPRSDIIALPHNSNLKQIKDIIIEQEHTRMPIYGENLDEINGFIHSKDLVKFLPQEAQEFDMKSLIRKIIFIPHSMKIIDLLRKMRYSRVHIAIVLDEYGGTDGLVTIEDIVEEIVGEIEDEHDMPEPHNYNKIKKISNNIFEVGGRVETSKLSNLFDHEITKEQNPDFETISGFILSKMKKVPKPGEVLELRHNISIKILEANLRSIKLIEIKQSLTK